MTYQYQNYIPNSEAVKIEVIITRPDGTNTRLVCDAFDYIEIEKFMEPEYFHPFDNTRGVYGGPITKSLSFIINHPRTWTVYLPQPAEQPAIDDGTVVEEAE